MQFDRRSSQRVQALPQDSFLPNNLRIKSDSFANGSWFHSVTDDLKKESKWSKGVGGRYQRVTVTPVVKKVDDVVKPVTEPKLAVSQAKVAAEQPQSKPVKSKKKNKPRRTTERRQSKYDCWEFGKTKSFIPPKNNKKNNKAAIQIQRIARGGWQRIHYKIDLLQHKLDTREERTRDALDQVQKNLKERKARYLAKMTAKAKKDLEKDTASSRATRDAQDIIAYLRKENKKLRAKNEKLYTSICDLKYENDRLEKATEEMMAAFDVLDAHAKEINKTHKHLKEVIPKYRKAVRELEDTLDFRQQAFAAEHKVKSSYMNTVADVVETTEARCKDNNLVTEVVDYLLNMNDEPTPREINFQGSVTEIEDYSEVTAESEDLDFDDYQIS